MLRLLVLVQLLAVAAITTGQLPYMSPLYSVDTVRNISYGTDTTFNGSVETLYFDLYRPIGDSNCLRPVAVVVHGGAWVAGTKQDPNIVYFATELARRGWLAVAPEYRLGNHKTTNYTMYALCNASLADPCAYAYDSAEVIRANYRGMQDIKGLLRHLSLRAALDSADMDNLFLIGESAGGFVALTTAFTDRPTEKPAAAGQLASVQAPDPDMYAFGCLPSGSDFSRPDLGSIHGNFATQISDPVVRGVASIYGGVLDSTLFVQTGSYPRVFLFHQGSDVIVDYDFGRLLSRISVECFAPTNICQPIYNYPKAWGGEGISRIFSNMGSQAPIFRSEIVYNYEYGNDCFDNGHSIDNTALRFSQVLQFFAEGIDTTFNYPPNACSSSLVNTVVAEPRLNAMVNGGYLQLVWSGSPVRQQVVIFGSDGKKAAEVFTESNNVSFDVSGWPAGVYIVRLIDSGLSRKLVIE